MTRKRHKHSSAINSLKQKKRLTCVEKENPRDTAINAMRRGAYASISVLGYLEKKKE